MAKEYRMLTLAEKLEIAATIDEDFSSLEEIDFQIETTSINNVFRFAIDGTMIGLHENGNRLIYCQMINEERVFCSFEIVGNKVMPAFSIDGSHPEHEDDWGDDNPAYDWIESYKGREIFMAEPMFHKILLQDAINGYGSELFSYCDFDLIEDFFVNFYGVGGKLNFIKAGVLDFSDSGMMKIKAQLSNDKGNL